MGTKSNQKELPGMPGMDDIGKAATDLLDIMGNMDNLKARADELKIELINLFKLHKRNSVTVEGHVFTYSHLEKDQVKIKKPEYN